MVIAFLFMLQSCGVKKFLSEDQYLIKKYKINVQGEYPEISTSELKTLLSPSPNSSFFSVRYKLWTYYKNKKNSTKFNSWLYKHFGEEPVFYNEKNATNITRKMERYLNNVGFFNSNVTFTDVRNNHVAKVIFKIIPSKPYKISKLSYVISDSLLKTFVQKKSDKSLIKVNSIYNAYTFDNERDRITEDLRNNGYYFFNRNYIQFIVDSNLTDHTMDVELVITNVKTQDKKSADGFIEENHKRYFIKNITVLPEFNPTNLSEYDTIVHSIKFWKESRTYPYFFLYNDKINILPSAFNSAIKIKPGDVYSAKNVQATYRKIFNYQIIQTANISFDTTTPPSNALPDAKYLVSRIQMRDNALNRFSAEVEGTNSSGDLGVRGSLVFLNKNIFRKAEVLRIRLKGGFEAQSVSETAENSAAYFNTFEAGIDGTIFFPRFLSPIRLDRFNQKYIPNTNLNFGYNFQQRPNYSRFITNADIGYAWKSSSTVSNIYTPISINYVNIDPSAAFADTLANEPNRRLREQYSDHLVGGTKYSYTFNNQSMTSIAHFNYLRVDLELAGNLFYAFNKIANTQISDSGYYSILGVRYSQFFRFNIDYRHYFYFSKKTNVLASRLLFGAGIPYLNSEELPYEKGFYAGGANDMRGWLFKDLGPGEYSGSSPYEKVGDIQIEGNLEYRFPIYSFFKGALFTDIGNIWTYKQSSSFPGGKFYINKFVSQLAVDVGIGFRFDFQILIFRIDGAAPIRNPAFPEGDRFRLKYLHPTDIVWNFGIGYPF